MKIDTIVDKYIALRDKKDAIRREYQERVAAIDAALTKVEGVLLTHFNDTGSESVRTASGTAYKASRTSATVADWDMFFDYVLSKQAWQLLEHRVAKKAVEEIKEQTGDIPPGVNWSSEIVVNVRRG